jgi:hypothetical protein
MLLVFCVAKMKRWCMFFGHVKLGRCFEDGFRLNITYSVHTTDCYRFFVEAQV